MKAKKSWMIDQEEILLRLFLSRLNEREGNPETPGTTLIRPEVEP